MQHVTQDIRTDHLQTGRSQARPASIHHLTLVHDASQPARAWRFNSRDLIALSCWMTGPDRHGYARAVVESGCSEAEDLDDGAGDAWPEGGSYVLFYEPGSDWACWGVARSGAELVTWHCATGADFGRYPTMLAALDGLPRAIGPVPTAKTAYARIAAQGASSPTSVATQITKPRLTLVHSH